MIVARLYVKFLVALRIVQPRMTVLTEFDNLHNLPCPSFSKELDCADGRDTDSALEGAFVVKDPDS